MIHRLWILLVGCPGLPSPPRASDVLPLRLVAEMSMPIRLDPSEGYEFEALARYNAERARGIAHTPEWDALMASEQERFNRQQRERLIAEGGRPLDPENPDGAWMVPGPMPSRWERLRWWIEEHVR